MDKKGVSNFGVRASWADLSVVGLILSEAALSSQQGWTIQTHGPRTVEFEPERGGQGRFHIPLIVMTAANARQYEKRWGMEGTPERIRDKVQMALDAMRAGECEGVVTYCLNKKAGNPDYSAVQPLFLRYSRLLPLPQSTWGRIKAEAGNKK